MPKLRAAVLIIPILISGCEAPELQVTEVSGDITGLSQWAPERLLPANFYDLALEEASAVWGATLRLLTPSPLKWEELAAHLLTRE